MLTVLQTLTDFEEAGLHAPLCLADGHAYQDLHPAFSNVIQSLPEIWHTCVDRTIPEASQLFNESYSRLINAPILKSFNNYKICPTASNSIDLIAAVLKCKDLDAVLIEPAFDNLALLVRRRGVKLDSVRDIDLFQAAERNDIDDCFPSISSYGALFIVNPNNPTGITLSENGFKNIVNFCKRHDLVLVIDNCFRIYRKSNYSDYEILLNSSVSFMAFEDTGKVWSTQDMKASLVYYSDDLASIFSEIYNEVYLCVSNFSLGVIASFIDKTSEFGIDKIIWDTVDSRRRILRNLVENSRISVSEMSQNSTLPVEWLSCEATNKNDFLICEELRHLGLAILPGRQFYWNSSKNPCNQKNIRISLMKRETVFLKGINILRDYLALDNRINFSNDYALSVNE